MNSEVLEWDFEKNAMYTFDWGFIHRLRNEAKFKEHKSYTVSFLSVHDSTSFIYLPVWDPGSEKNVSILCKGGILGWFVEISCWLCKPVFISKVVKERRDLLNAIKNWYRKQCEFIFNTTSNSQDKSGTYNYKTVK